MKNNKTLVEKWDALLNNEDLPAIQTATKTEIVAQILENQEQDSVRDPAYSDPAVLANFGYLSEAVITGDHGGDPTNIASGVTTGAVTNVAPAVMGFVRRAIPNMIAFDVAGVQPLNISTGQVFTFRSMYGRNPLDADAREAFHPMNAPDVMYSGYGSTTAIPDFVRANAYAVGDFFKFEFVRGSHDLRYFQVVVAGAAPTPDPTLVPSPTDEDYLEAMLAAGNAAEIGLAMATSLAELQENFNDSSNNPWNEMSFRIDKQTVEAKSRQLKATYSMELAQDLRNVHGMDADSELNGILATEILLEINREVILWINATAQIGKTGWTNTVGSQAGVWNINSPLDNRGARWAGESYKALIIQIHKEANEIARQTGRGAGNIIITTRNVVSALAMTDMLVGPAAQGAQSGLNTDTTKGTFAGVLAGKFSVYIDQYALEDYVTVGYKGPSAMDCGIVYSPYIPLTPVRGTNPANFQPVIGFKTRYAISVNPLANPALDKGSLMGKLTSAMPNTNTFGKNSYFRKFRVVGL